MRFGSIDSYGRIKKIGEGAFGAVSKARHLGTGELVAIKTVLEGGKDEELLREAGLLALCGGNPAVVELREVARCTETSKLCLVMEFVGPSLLDILRRRRRLGRAFSESATRRVMRELLGGVEAMHAQGVVHRDLKPGNVLVGERDGRVRICDLGLGKAMAKAPPHTQSVGTLWYMAPEQLLEEEEYGAPVDLWSLGCVMGELLTGERLFDQRTEDAQLWAIADKLGVPDDGSLDAATPSQLRDMVPEDLLSRAGFDVLRGLLEYDARDRLTASAALQMPWFASQ